MDPLGIDRTTGVHRVATGAVRGYMDRVQSEYAAFGRDVAAHGRELGGEYVQAWWAQAAAWNTFYEGSKDDLWLGDSEFNDTRRYEEQLLDFRAKYSRKLGKTPESPGPVVPEPPPEVKTPLSDVESIVKWLVIGYAALHVLPLVTKASGAYFKGKSNK